MKRIIGAGITALLLTGCAQTDTTGERSFESLNELAKTVGWDCRNRGTETDRDSLAKYGFTQLPCHPDGNLSLYTSDAKRSELQGHSWNALKPGWCRINGRNWTVSGSQYLVEDAHEKVGGTMVCAGD